MALKNISEGGNFELPEPGLYPMVVTGVVDVGLQATQYGTKHKVVLTFELIGTAMSDGRPFVLSKPFTLSMHRKGNLLPFLEALRGRSFTADERRDFDLTKVAGKPGRAMIQHATSEAGKTYANIASALPPERDQPRTTVNDILVYDCDEPNPVVYSQLPQWLRDKIDSRTVVEKKEPASKAPAPEFDDDISF